MDSQTPREAWQRLQSALKTQGGRSGFPGGGARPPKGILGGFGGLVLLGGLYFTFNSALFNGMKRAIAIAAFLSLPSPAESMAG